MRDKNQQSLAENGEITNQLDAVIAGVRDGDPDAMARFILRFHKPIQSVAFDVLQNEEMAKDAARETIRTAVRQLQRGVRTGAVEPWLMWLTRDIALPYSQLQGSWTPVQERPVNEARPLHIVTNETRGVPKTETTPDAQAAVFVPPAIKGQPARQDRANQREESHIPAQRYAQAPVDDAVTQDTLFEEILQENPVQHAKRPRAGVLDIIMTVGMVLVILLLVWVVMGLLSKNGILDIPDWGYGWFNEHLFRLF